MSVFSSLLKRGGTSGNNNRGLNPFNTNQMARSAVGGANAASQAAAQNQAATFQQQGTQQANAAAQQQAEQQRKIQEMTARRMMLLRQNVMGNQGGAIAALRRNLAQRGALDSGSLGANISRIGNESANTLAQGTQHAALGENEALLGLMNRENDRRFAREQSATNYDRDRALLQLRSSLERRNKPSGIESLLSGVGSAAGTALPGWLSSLFGEDEE